MPDVSAVHVNGPLTGRKGRKRLSKVRVDFISLVDRPDCPSATVQILKRAPIGTTPRNQNLGAQRRWATSGSVVNTTRPGGALMPQGSESDTALSMEGLPEEVVKYILALEDEVLKAAEDDDDIEGEYDDDDDPDAEYEEYDDDEDAELTLEDLTEDELAEVLDELEAEGFVEEAALTKLAKVAPPAVVATIAKMQDRLAHAERQSAQDRLARRVTEFRKRAQDMDQLPIPASDLADILLKAEEALPGPDYQVLEGLLRKTNNQLGESRLFDEIGSAGADTSNSQLDELAKRAMQVAEHSGAVSAERALLKMLETDPTSYDLEERARTMGGRR